MENEEDKRFLLQIDKRTGLILNIGVWDEVSDTYISDVGSFDENHEREHFEYKNLDDEDLRRILNNTDI
jgi:hypothetical protein